MVKQKIILLVVIICTFATVAMAQTQLEMNEQAHSKYEKADKEMNRVYQQILKSYHDELFIQKLKAAQRAWLAYRDAHLEELYPAKDPKVEYGSVYPMCYSIELEDLTIQRTKVLRQWLDGVQEGDVCTGSRPAK